MPVAPRNPASPHTESQLELSDSLVSSVPAGTSGSPRSRALAAILGFAGLILCAVTPLLPITQSTATLNWPQNGSVNNVVVPLTSAAPTDLNITISCAINKQLPVNGGLILSTIPTAGKDALNHGLFITATADRVEVTFRNNLAASVSRADFQSPNCSTLTVWANTDTVGATFNGLTNPTASGTLPTEFRPQLSGVFTDFTSATAADLQLTATIDTRFSSRPTLIKTASMILGALALLGSLSCLALLENSRNRFTLKKIHHWLPTTTGNLIADIGVIGTLILWAFIGAGTSSDGYIFTMARAANHSDYIPNYFRFFGATEAPFDWYPSLLSAWSTISTVSFWMRIPALCAGIICWLVVSRAVLPRLGALLRPSKPVLWTAGLVFLAFWLPFNNGLRAEPIIATGAVLTWVLIERSISTQRLLPSALAIVISGLTLATAPHGVITLAVLLAGARPIAQIISSQEKTWPGRLALLTPLLTSAAVVLVIVFRDQSLASIAESIRIRYQVGPTVSWYQEFLRYYFLSVETVDGSLTRRFAVLTLILCLLGALFVLLRRGSIPGVNTAPAWRLIGSVLIGLLLLGFTPTKWTVQFGIFAGFAGALGGLVAVTVITVGLHSRRNLSLFVSALLFVLAFSTSGINGYFYTYNFGIPWFDRQPVLAGKPVTTAFLALAVLAALLGAWQHFRLDYAGHTEVKNNTRNRILASTPLMTVAAAMVLLEVLSFAKGAVSRYPAYTEASSNINALRSNLCAMADVVLVENDSNLGSLQPLSKTENPLGGVDPIGFNPNGVAKDLAADPDLLKVPAINTDGAWDAPVIITGENSGTGGGQGAKGINGSTALLPFGLDRQRTPIMGSYGSDSEPASLISQWYVLPNHTEANPLIVITAAGAIWSENQEGGFTYGQSIRLEYGKTTSDGNVEVLGNYLPIDIGPSPSWRNLRIPRQDLPLTANVVRIVALDPNLSEDQWVAFTPPRVPELTTLQNIIGSEKPVLLDLAVGQQFPCQRPAVSNNGVSEVPDYRILPDRKNASATSKTWQAAASGGPFLITESLTSATTLPSYLQDDWYRDWGSVEKLNPLLAAPAAELAIDEATRSGWWRPGPIRALP
ncbi:MAG: arabinosyltransferase domain-containing protein [Mycobacteriaceae bacterium]